MPVNKPIILNQEEDNTRPMKDEISKKNNNEAPTDKNSSAGDGYEMPDKLIGDDLEIEKVKKGKDPEIDSNREPLGY
jgi:hypothetical protein